MLRVAGPLQGWMIKHGVLLFVPVRPWLSNTGCKNTGKT